MNYKRTRKDPEIRKMPEKLEGKERVLRKVGFEVGQRSVSIWPEGGMILLSDSPRLGAPNSPSP